MKLEGLSGSQQRRIEVAKQNVPFASLVGIELESVGPGVATMTLEVRDVLRQNNGVVHGGLTFTLADAAFGYASNSHGTRSAGIVRSPVRALRM